eukprot:TRINITY_DN492_c0_g3_i1.p1 TRINITY_DN492_c0_g3~~TRINITY_DN492_c0_g3_i1.p1  ORF type:complete len:197 (-),score=115.91 TRINITY_DN492_c0_g3_i1:44-634(-)
MSFETAKIMFVLGGPGAGKGTVCSRLQNELNAAHFSAGDLLRKEANNGTELGQTINQMMKNGEIVPSHVTIRLLREAIQSRPDCTLFLIDGFPRNIAQGQEFEANVRSCTGVLYLDAPEQVMTQRILGRAEEIRAAGQEVRVDDNLESLKKRLQTHFSTCLPVVDYYQQQNKVLKIDATKATAEVFEQCKVALNSI